ncbi:MAG: zinc ABC transporter substrate-binding protein [Candidatus Peribacteraceae bacterium]|nr:zinc ABC transporter substrate-binding protein [Candidatus Peribacteraceae bacterium]
MKDRMIFPLLLASIVLAGCAQGRQADDGTLPVAASFYPLAHFAEQVGGGHVRVRQVLPSGVEPHDYEPSPGDLRVMSDAKVFLFNGGIDPWGDRLRADLEKDGVIVVEMAEHADVLVHAAHAHDGNEEEEHDDTLHDEGHDHGPFDPHFWMDPLTAKTEVAEIRDALIAADATHAEDYRRNAEDYLARLDALDRQYRDGLASCTLKEIIVSHDAFRYLANRYGFHTLPINGVDQEEPSARAIAELISNAKAKGIRTVFFETTASPKLSETIAREAGASTQVLHTLHGLTEEEERNGDTYISIMERNLSRLQDAMQCR